MLVDVAKDVQEAEIDFTYPHQVDLPGGDHLPVCTHDRFARRRGPCSPPQRPVLYVGGGVVNGDACAELLELAETGGIPVITTLMAKSAFPESHPLLLRASRHARLEVGELGA